MGRERFIYHPDSRKDIKDQEKASKKCFMFKIFPLTKMNLREMLTTILVEGQEVKGPRNLF